MCGDSLGKNIQILFLLAGIDLARLEGVPDGSRKIRRDDHFGEDRMQHRAVETGLVP